MAAFRCLYTALVVLLTGLPVAIARKPRNPVRIFLLVGDGAAQGYASLEQLRDLTLSDPDNYGHLRNDDPKAKSIWAVRDDVYVTYQGQLNQRWQHKPLSADMGLSHSDEEFGPEVELGYILGEVYEEPVIIVKCAWHGKSLNKDFRPPSVGPAGHYYKQILADVKQTIRSINGILMGQALKDYRGAGHSIEGLIWWHGYSDVDQKETRERYTADLKHFMSDIRKDLGSPFLPIVIGELGGMGTRRVTVYEHNFRVYQERAVKDDPAQMSHFVKTHDKLDQKDIGFDKEGYEFYYHQAAFMVKIGAAFAEGLLLLLNGDDDDAGGAVNANPYTIDEGVGDFERFEENQHNKLVIIFAALMFGSVLFFALLQNGFTRRALSSASLRSGWSRTMERIRPVIGTVIPTDDDGNVVLGVVVLPTNAVAEAASNSLAYVDSRARSSYAYADEAVRSFRIPEVQFVIRTGDSDSAENSVVQVSDSGTSLEAEMVAA